MKAVYKNIDVIMKYRFFTISFILIGHVCLIQAGPCLSKLINQVDNFVDDDSNIVHLEPV